MQREGCKMQGAMTCSLTWAGRVPFEDKMSFVTEQRITFKGTIEDKEIEMRRVEQGEGKCYGRQKECSVKKTAVQEKCWK